MFVDAFDDRDQTLVYTRHDPARWAAIPDSLWRVKGGTAQLESTVEVGDEPGFAVVPTSGKVTEFSVKLDPAPDAGIVWRFADPENYWEAHSTQSSSIAVQRVERGQVKDVGEFSYQIGEPFEISVEIENEGGTVLLDGIKKLQYRHEDIASRNLDVGLLARSDQARSASWDNPVIRGIPVSVGVSDFAFRDARVQTPPIPLDELSDRELAALSERTPANPGRGG